MSGSAELPIEKAIRERKTELAQKIRSYQEELEGLERLLPLYHDGELQQQERTGGPTEAVMAMARANPGVDFKTLVAKTVAVVETKAVDPEHSIQNTLYRLLSEGKLVRRGDDGGIYPRGFRMLLKGDREVEIR